MIYSSLFLKGVHFLQKESATLEKAVGIPFQKGAYLYDKRI